MEGNSEPAPSPTRTTGASKLIARFAGKLVPHVIESLPFFSCDVIGLVLRYATCAIPAPGSRADVLHSFALPRAHTRVTLAVAPNGDGTLWVAKDGCCQLFSLRGEFIRKVSLDPYNPTIAFDARTGEVFCSQTDSSKRVFVHRTDGSFVRGFRWEESTVSTMLLESPTALAVNSDGLLLALYSHKHLLQVRNRNGKYLTQFGGGYGSGDGQLHGPSCMALSSTGTGHVFVGDAGNHRVQVFDAKGQFIRKFGSGGVGVGQFRQITSIALDSADNVFVCEGRGNRVQVFSATGTFLSEIRGPEHQLGFSSVCVDDCGRIFVGDLFGVVQVFGFVA